MAISLDHTYMTNYNMDTVAAAADKLSSQIEGAATDEETMEACKQFEAYMVEQMFKGMEEAAKVLTEDDEDDDSNQYVDMFHDNYIQSIAESMIHSGQSIGLAEQLYRSIKNQSGTNAEAIAQAVTLNPSSEG